MTVKAQGKAYFAWPYPKGGDFYEKKALQNAVGNADGGNADGADRLTCVSR